MKNVSKTEDLNILFWGKISVHPEGLWVFDVTKTRCKYTSNFSKYVKHVQLFLHFIDV